MRNSDQAGLSDSDANALFADSLRRIERMILIAPIPGAIALLLYRNMFVASGFLTGAAIASLNFCWLKKSVFALAHAIAESRISSGASVVLRFFARFILIAFAAYVILTRYLAAFPGFLAGLSVPVMAFFVEAAYLVASENKLSR